jgi:hypothetical protein
MIGLDASSQSGLYSNHADMSYTTLYTQPTQPHYSQPQQQQRHSPLHRKFLRTN